MIKSTKTILKRDPALEPLMSAFRRFRASAFGGAMNLEFFVRNNLTIAQMRAMHAIGHAGRLEQRRQVDPKSAAQPLLHPVPAADRIGGAAAPRLDRPLGRGLLLVRPAERHPVAVLLEHRVEVLDAAELVAQLRAADL